ncbi:ABC transporter ATP-binding protein [Paenibacillus sp. IB182496]|uniref:ABC transporter ATP-binding protein n=1 Tax=Paenibacillus sabuli TaxID=2772509 RepID=A0A927GQJ8_9BACL|nr:ABC transporter ATP-binding protein [Paenibacillus sabuli]MBD2844351.1 ABC transporter ATP-binding protein [Paenibacillus sabuli]
MTAMASPSLSAASEEQEIALECRNVGKDYFRHNGERVRVVREVDLKLRKGGFLCVLGPSGCGKTTLLNMVAGFEQTTEGDILVGGKPVNGPGPERGVVFQSDTALFPWLTVRENIEYGLRIKGISKAERRKRADEWIEQVGLTQHTSKFPGELSGGMKQRVQIARVLASDPEILLMDEPFAALDAQTRNYLQQELSELCRKSGKTVLFITHDIQEALMLADHIIVMARAPEKNIKAELHVQMPYPRQRMNETFAKLYNRLMDEIDNPFKGSVRSL